MLIISRSEALSAGRKRYFTGEPCKRGHTAERITINGRCTACQRDDQAKYYTEKPELLKERARSWKSKNREIVRQYDRRKSSGAAVTAKLKNWRRKNPEKAKAHDRNCNARRKGAVGKHSAGDIAQIIRHQRGRCAYCLTKITLANREIDHIQPLSKGGTNHRHNIQVLCRPCNQRKRDHHPAEFARSIGLLI
jgi:5-methylcytosine-specific restriction endonuclease McrA